MKTGKGEKAKNSFFSDSYKNLKIEEKSQLKSALDFKTSDLKGIS